MIFAFQDEMDGSKSKSPKKVEKSVEIMWNFCRSISIVAIDLSENDEVHKAKCYDVVLSFLEEISSIVRFTCLGHSSIFVMDIEFSSSFLFLHQSHSLTKFYMCSDDSDISRNSI